MKRTPLARKTGLRRRQPLRTRRRTAYRDRPRDRAYMAWIRRQPCAVRSDRWVADGDPCMGRMESDHAGLRGMGQKADDRTCIPLCHKHHVQRTSMSGVFRAFTKDMMRIWLDRRVAAYQHLYQETHHA